MKSKKLWQALLLGLVMLLMAVCFMSFVACDYGEETNDSKEEWTYDSVYAQAQSLGYEGTLEEFIALISGKDGADGVGVANAYVDENGNLIVVLTNGNEIDCGKVKGADGQDGQNGQDGADGQDGQDGKDGLNGQDGIGIKDVSVNEAGNLIVELTNGQEIDCGKVIGQNGQDGSDGQDGVGISNIYINESGHLIAILTDGRELDCGAVWPDKEGEDTILADSISLNKDVITLEIGETEELQATIFPTNATDKTVTWTSSMPSVVEVENGEVRALKAGIATIVAVTNNGKIATCTITVEEDIVDVTEIILSETNLRLWKNDKATIRATVLPSNATDKTITWLSSDSSVATVDNGMITALSAGEVTITATTSNGKIAECKVVVIKSQPIINIGTIESTQTEANFNIEINDVDKSILTQKAELFYADELQETITDISECSFDNLIEGSLYKVRVTITYDLNDGNGVQTYMEEREFITEIDSSKIEIQDVDIVLPVAAMGGNFKMRLKISSAIENVNFNTIFINDVSASLTKMKNGLYLATVYVPQEKGLMSINITGVSYSLSDSWVSETTPVNISTGLSVTVLEKPFSNIENVTFYNVFEDKYGNTYILNDKINDVDYETNTIYYTDFRQYILSDEMVIKIDNLGAEIPVDTWLSSETKFSIMKENMESEMLELTNNFSIKGYLLRNSGSITSIELTIADGIGYYKCIYYGGGTVNDGVYASIDFFVFTIENDTIKKVRGFFPSRLGSINFDGYGVLNYKYLWAHGNDNKIYYFDMSKMLDSYNSYDSIDNWELLAENISYEGDSNYDANFWPLLMEVSLSGTEYYDIELIDGVPQLIKVS